MSSIVNDKLKVLDLAKIIAKLGNKFSSHDFLKKFSHEYELEYIEMLYAYKGKGGFKEVHKQIAKYLSDNKDSLKINRSGKINSENIFGDVVEVQYWEK